IKNNAVVGSLPQEWVNTIPEISKKQEIKDILDGFAAVSKTLMLDADTAIKYYYDFKDDHDSLKPLIQDNIDNASVQLTELLKKHNIIKDNDKVQLEYLGIGLHGCGYKFIVNDKKYVIKSYHNYSKEEMLRNDYHGPLIESNRAAYIHKHFKNNNYARFYFSDLKANYMILQFIDAKTSLPEMVISEIDNGFNYNDLGDKEKYNLVNNYLIDYGSISIKSSILTTKKTAKWVHNKVVSDKTSIADPEKWDQLYQKAIKNKIPNCNDILLGLIDAVRFLPEEHREKRVLKMINSTYFSDDFRINLIDYIAPDKALFPIYEKANFQLFYKQRLNALDNLIKVSGKTVNEILVSKISTIKTSLRFELFKMLLNKSDKGLQSSLQHQIIHLPVSKQKHAYNLLSAKTSA
ncbi:MAG: hypothetical protein AB7V50_07415, partial [Vampirovibrionia bacterium]